MNDILDYAKRILGIDQEQPASPEAELLLKQVEAERAGRPLPGSVAYERQQQTLPTPSQYDVIQPSAPQGPRDYTDYAAAWLADKIQDPNLSPSDRAAATRRMQEVFALPADLLGLQSAYNAGQQGALGNYGTAAFEGAMAALPVAVEARPLVREAMSVIRARPAAQDVVDLARRQLFMPSTVSAEGPVIGPTTALDRLLETPVDRRQVNQAIAAAPVVAKLGPEVAATVTEAAPKVIAPPLDPSVVSSHLEDILSKPLSESAVGTKFVNDLGEDAISNSIFEYSNPVLHGTSTDTISRRSLINPDTELLKSINGYSETDDIFSSANTQQYVSSHLAEVKNELEHRLGTTISDEDFQKHINSIVENDNSPWSLQKKILTNNATNFLQPEGDMDESVTIFRDFLTNYARSTGDKWPGIRGMKKFLRENMTPENIVKYGLNLSKDPKHIEDFLNTTLYPHDTLSYYDEPVSMRKLLDDQIKGYISKGSDSYMLDEHIDIANEDNDLKRMWEEARKRFTGEPKTLQVESAPRASDQALGVKEEPTLSISEQRQAAQERIKALRAQLNAVLKGTPEHEALKAQIAEEGAKLGQLRGPAQEAVVKEAPPVEIKSRSPTGLYSEAEEIARRLPQADTPENLVKAILNKGVKDAELIDARVMNKDRTPTPEFTEYLASRGSQQPISDAVGDYIATNLPTLQKRVLAGRDAAYINSPTLKEHPDGGSDYRELLFHYPGSGYDGGHWRTIQPDTAMHARVENKPDSLFVHEMQADQAQQGRQRGFLDVDARSNLERLGAAYNDARERLKIAENNYYKIDNAYKEALGLNQPTSDLYQQLLESKKSFDNTFAEYERIRSDHIDAMNNTAASGIIPYAPHMEDTGAWTRAMAKELVTEAVDSGKGKIEISGGSVQNFRANAPGTAPEDYVDHSHYYNVIVPSEFKAVLKELDPSADMDKVVRVRKVKPTDSEVENDPSYHQTKEMVKDMTEEIQKYPDQGEIDALKSFYGDDWEEQANITKGEMYEELAGHQEILMQFFDRRDRVEINLTPKMIEAIKGKKLKKYFQGGRVE